MIRKYNKKTKNSGKKFIAILVLGLLCSCSDSSVDSKKMELGSKIYSNMCIACHDSVAPNLNEIKLEMAQIIFSVTGGKGMMPAFQGTLTVEEIESVAYYILKEYGKN
tara:strand:- start:228 stop:551 length:324 start_codon:yes stop_codon:yes gene_type:complete